MANSQKTKPAHMEGKSDADILESLNAPMRSKAKGASLIRRAIEGQIEAKAKGRRSEEEASKGKRRP